MNPGGYMDSFSSNRLPLFDGTNYTYWKARMKSALKSIDERVWVTVERGWSPPTMVVNDEIILTPVEQWCEEELKWCNFNSKGLNALFGVMTPN